MSDTMEQYKQYWQKQFRVREKRRVERQHLARELAEKCAQILKEDFGVDTVFLIGSVVTGEGFHSRSDIDLAVEGLSPSRYFSALARCWEVLPPGFELDLIPLEDIDPERRNELYKTGERIVA